MLTFDFIKLSNIFKVKKFQKLSENYRYDTTVLAWFLGRF